MGYGFNQIFCCKDGSVWIDGERKGIGKLNLETHTLNYIVPHDTIAGGFSSDDYPYCDDGNQNFYLCGIYQIIQINYKTLAYTVFDINNYGLSTSHNRIAGATTDNAGNVWLATRNQGLAAFNFRTKKLYRFSIKNGLPTNKASRILFVNGVLWVSHLNGIYKFAAPENLNDTTQKLFVKSYTVKDGLPVIDLDAKGMIQYGSNQIALAFDSTVLLFCPDSIQLNKYLPPIVITSLRVNNNLIEPNDSTKILHKNIFSTDTVYLHHNQNSLSFDYAALSYIHTENNEYAYKMGGIDTSWIYSGKRRFVTYSNLNPVHILFM